MKHKLSPYIQDLPASLVGFLIAIPLSLGIAMASGAPPALGLVSAILGCLMVGSFTRASLMITGPAAGLIAVTMDTIHQYGLASLGVIVLLAGVIQILAGLFKVGQLFRSITPAVIHGLMAGIGLIIVLSQYHAMFDVAPPGDGFKNLINIPQTLGLAFSTPAPSPHSLALIVAVATIAMMLLYPLLPKALKVLPSSLYAIGSGMALANLMHWPVKFVQIPHQFTENFHYIDPGNLLQLFLNPTVLMAAFSMAFIASAKALLTANALEQMHDYERTRNNEELIAQGIGNVLCGLLGGLPISGEILRSTTNVQAGARSRASLILIGLWILLFVMVFPQFLERIPSASLAGLLVITGLSLISPHHIKNLLSHDKGELAIYLATALTVVLIDPLQGVMLGMILGLIKLGMGLSQLSIQLTPGDPHVDLQLEGCATFINLPALVTVLEKITPGVAVHVGVDQLIYLDNACYEALKSWEKVHCNTGGSVSIDWEHLKGRMSRAVVHAGPPTIKPV